MKCVSRKIVSTFIIIFCILAINTAYAKAGLTEKEVVQILQLDIKASDRTASMEQVAEYICKKYNLDINTVKGKENPYKDSTSDFVRKLYANEVLTGSGILGKEVITKERLFDIERRVKNISGKEIYLANELYKLEIPSNLDKLDFKVPENVDKLLLYMLNSDIEKYTINKNKTSESELSAISDSIFARYEDFHDKYIEATGFYSGLSGSLELQTIDYRNKVDTSGSVSMNLYKEGSTMKDVRKLRYLATDKARKILSDMYKNNALNSKMTDSEKAKVLYGYLIKNITYTDDTKANNVYNAYGSLVEGKAVCQGYTAAYNLLLKMEGIEAVGCSGKATNDKGTENHIWTKAKLEGKWYYIDVTWGDGYEDYDASIDYTYFKIPEVELRKTHSW